MTKEEIKNAFVTVNDQPIGFFYALHRKERDYHELAIIHILSREDYYRTVIQNMVNKANVAKLKKLIEVETNSYQVTKLCMEKRTPSGRYIDIFFELVFSPSGEVFPFVLELKTDTNNHDEQLSAYVNYIDQGKENQAYKDNAQYYYISLDGKEPKANSDAERNYVCKYVCMKYCELITNIKNCNESIVNDYIKTINMLESGVCITNYEKLLIYLVFFEEIAKSLNKTKAGLVTELELFAKNKGSSKYYKITEINKLKEWNEQWKGVYLALFITNSVGRLGLERRWEYKKKHGWQNSMYYGINGDFEIPKEDECNRKYFQLVEHWYQIGERNSNKRELNVVVENGRFKLRTEEEDKESRREYKKRVNNKKWCAVQYLDNWTMKYLDRLEIVHDISDPFTWAKWIERDFELIES